MDFVVATLRRYVTSADQTVVDVGCGPALYRGATVGHYVGVDRAPDSYDTGEPTADLVAPADEIPLAASSVDVLFTLSAFYAFDRHDAVLREFRRLLRPGGRLILFDYNRRALARLARGEGRALPQWTGLQLGRRIRRAGFRDTRLLLPAVEQPTGATRLAKLLQEELRGQWAIVTGVAPS